MSEERKRINSERAKQNMENGKNPFSKKEACPHCGVEANIATLKRSHYDNCKVYQKQLRSTWIAKSSKLR